MCFSFQSLLTCQAHFETVVLVHGLHQHDVIDDEEYLPEEALEWTRWVSTCMLGIS